MFLKGKLQGNQGTRPRALKQHHEIKLCLAKMCPLYPPTATWMEARWKTELLTMCLSTLDSLQRYLLFNRSNKRSRDIHWPGPALLLDNQGRGPCLSWDIRQASRQQATNPDPTPSRLLMQLSMGGKEQIMHKDLHCTLLL